MWSKSNIHSFGFNHFVSLVDIDETMPIVDVNMIPIGYSDDLSRKVPIEIDLTKEMNEDEVGVDNNSQIDSEAKKESNEEAGKNIDGWLCTLCYQTVSMKSNVYMFDRSRYNFEHDIVRNVLDEMIRCCDHSGDEFICRFCHNCLESWDNPKYPMKCIYLAQNKNESSVFHHDKKKNVDSKVEVEALLRKISEFEVKKELKERIKNEIDIEKKVTKNKSKKDALLQKAASKFKKSCKEFPEFVCTCCHHMMFYRSVIKFKEGNYYFGGVCSRALSDRYCFKDNEKEHEYICTTCDRKLRKNEMPCQAVANGLQIPKVPRELQGLTRLECRCIGLRIPFMSIRALPKGGQGKIRGPCVNVPATLEPIADVLPQIPENIDLVLLKFKRMITYKSNYLCDYIRPEKVMKMLCDG